MTQMSFLRGVALPDPPVIRRREVVDQALLPAATSSRVSGGEGRIYTMRELNQRTAEVMKEIEEHGPAFITKHGRFVAVITPLAAGQVESAVLGAIAREINEEDSADARDTGRETF